MKESLRGAKLWRVSRCDIATEDRKKTPQHLFGPERIPADIFLFYITAVGFANPSVAISNRISWSDTIKGC